MLYRENTKLDSKTSLLGFGLMRLPVDKDGKIDDEKAFAMVDYAMEHGVNYYDTAYGYHGEMSEDFVGRAVCARHPRESFYLADKLPVWITPTKEKAEEIYQIQMKKMQTDYVDFHLLHALNKERFNELKENGVMDWQEEKKAQGVFKRVGFSFHDKPEVLEEILAYKAWDFCQIQLNYLDWNLYKSKEMYELCEKYGVPVVIMEPIRGGSLSNPHTDVQNVFKAVQPELSPSAIALRFVANLDNVITILSGMSDESHVKENIETISNFEGLSQEEEKMYEDARAIFDELPHIPCTSCRYCDICPEQIEMWELFTKYNHFVSYNDAKPLVDYVKKHDEEHLPPACILCYACESQCPQQINITEEIQKVYKVAKAHGA